MTIDAIVIGVSAGGFKVLEKLITGLKRDLTTPIIIVQHISSLAENYIVTYLDERTELYVKEVEEKENIQAGTVYIAPPNYHILVERNKTLSLTVDKRVSYARPSIDVLFETAAEVYQHKLLGVVLTGANSDGTHGCKAVKKWGGMVVAQDPDEAEFNEMPLSVIQENVQDRIMTINALIEFINLIN